MPVARACSVGSSTDLRPTRGELASQIQVWPFGSQVGGANPPMIGDRAIKAVTLSIIDRMLATRSCLLHRKPDFRERHHCGVSATLHQRIEARCTCRCSCDR